MSQHLNPIDESRIQDIVESISLNDRPGNNTHHETDFVFVEQYHAHESCLVSRKHSERTYERLRGSNLEVASYSRQKQQMANCTLSTDIEKEVRKVMTMKFIAPLDCSTLASVCRDNNLIRGLKRVTRKHYSSTTHIHKILHQTLKLRTFFRKKRNIYI